MTRNLKLCLAVLLAMLCGGLASAQSFMTFYGSDACSMASWGLQEVCSVKFDGGNIVVNNSVGTDYIALGDVMSIKFTDDGHHPSSVQEIGNDASGLRIASNDNTVRVIGATSGTVAIWAANGQQLYDNRNWSGEEIDISHLGRGIYIITINNTTFKFKK